MRIERSATSISWIPSQSLPAPLKIPWDQGVMHYDPPPPLTITDLVGMRRRGIAVHTGARVAALAGPGEILVSRTIRDLVAGAPVRLDSRGEHELKGVPGSWEVFAVVS
jgi:hypothetical protein